MNAPCEIERTGSPSAVSWALPRQDWLTSPLSETWTASRQTAHRDEAHDNELMRFGKDGRFIVRRARSGEDRLRCWNLVYREYLAMGYVQPQDKPYRYTAHDALPNTATFFIEVDGRLAGCATVFPFSPTGQPADEAYGAELAALRQAGRRPVEVGRLTISSEFKHEREILARLFDTISIAARRLMDGTDLVVTVNPSHAKFYERMLCFERIGKEKTLGCVSGAPALLLRLSAETETAMRRWAHDEGPLPEKFDGGRTLYPRLSDRAGEETLVRRLRRTGSSAPLPESFLRRWFASTTSAHSAA